MSSNYLGRVAERGARLSCGRRGGLERPSLGRWTEEWPNCREMQVNGNYRSRCNLAVFAANRQSAGLFKLARLPSRAAIACQARELAPLLNREALGASGNQLPERRFCCWI